MTSLLCNPHVEKILAWTNIHDWTTYSVFLFLGIAQTFIAMDGVYLAVRALPSTTEVKPQRHTLLFWGAGITVLLLTACIGKLNDSSQNEATEKLADVRRQLTLAQGTLSDVDSKMPSFRAAVLSQPPCPQSVRDAQLAAAIDQIHGEISRTLASTNEATAPSVPATATPRTATPAQPGGPVTRPNDDIAALDRDLRSMAMNLTQLDRNVERMFAADIHGPMYLLAPHPANSQGISAEFASAISSLEAQRNSEYLRMVPQILALRTRAQKALLMTNLQIESDDAKFNELNKAASSVKQFAAGSPPNFDGNKMEGVVRYLSDLDESLKKVYPETVSQR